LGCRRFGHRLSECDHLAPPHQPALTAADALLQHTAHSGERGASGEEERDGAAAEQAEEGSGKAALPDIAAAAQSRKGRFCYHCGSAAHTAAHCVDQAGGGSGGSGGGGQFAFAVCFICQSVGHLARQCPSSDHGIFIRGGACHRCGSKQHKAKHCTAA